MEAQTLVVEPIMSKSILVKFLKFGMVGISGIAVDFAVTWLSKEQLGLQKYVANSLGFVAAASSNYYLNRVWTFESHDPNIIQEYGMFFLVSLAGLGLNNAFLYLFHEKGSIPFYIAKLLAIGAVFFWNFFANYFFTF